MINPRALFLIKLLSPFVLVFTVCFILLVTFLYFAGSNLLEDQFRQRVLDESQFLAFEYQEDGPVELLEEIEERLEKRLQSWRYLYAVQSPSGDWVFDALPHPPPPGWSHMYGLKYSDQALVHTRDLPGGYRLSVGISEHDLNTFRGIFLFNGGWLILASGFISILLGALVYHRFSKVIRTLAAPVQRFSNGAFDARIPEFSAGPDLEHLAHNINAMFAQVERLIDQLQNLSANIAHDLRTPLTRVKNHLTELSATLEPCHQQQLNAAESELEEVLRLFREILLLSEIQSGKLQTHFERVNLSQLLENCLEMYEPLLEQHHVQIECSIEPSTVVRGCPQLLKQVLINLIENTLNHSAGNCKLLVKLRSTKNHILLVFHDMGKAKISHKKHFGLGLGFVSAIIELHSGKVNFDDKSGLGFESQIQLPIPRDVEQP